MQVFYETVKAHVEEAFGARSFERGNDVIQDGAQSLDASKINGVILSCLDALTNNGLYLIAMVLCGGSGKFEKTRCKMKKAIRESLMRCLSHEIDDQKQKTTATQLYEVLSDPRNFRNNTMRSMASTRQFHFVAATHVLDRLKGLPFLTLAAMDRKLRCLKKVPQLQACGRSQKRERLIRKVSKMAKSMLVDFDKVGKLQEPLAKALAVADLSKKLTKGYRNTSETRFHQFSPEITNLQDDIVKAIWVLKMKVRFSELKTIQLLLDPNVNISNRSLRGAIINMLTEFLFECSDMDTIPKCLLETLSVINKKSRSMPHGSFLKDAIEEEVESILSVSAEMKQIVWDLLPDQELDEEFADAYGDDLDETDDDGFGGTDEDIGNEDLESFCSSVKSTEGDEFIQGMEVDPENVSSNEKGSEDINQVKNNGADPETSSNFSSNIQLGNGMIEHEKSSTCTNRYLAIQEACDETSLVAYDLIGRLLEKFAKDQGIDSDQSDGLYLRGDSSTQEHHQGNKLFFPLPFFYPFIELYKSIMYLLHC